MSTSMCRVRSDGARHRPTRSRWRGRRWRRGSSRCSRPNTAKSRDARRSGVACRSRTTSSRRSALRICSRRSATRRASRRSRPSPTAISRRSACWTWRRRVDKPFAITLDPGSSLANHTGSWRTMRPVYVDRLPPCNNACPAGENIQQWLFHAEGGNYEAAWRQLVQDNPMPAVMGRVCYHPCETACNRAQLDEAVGINSVERFLGDLAIERGWRIEPGPPTGKRVLVVGAGPSGLSAAYHLRRLGHDVTILEAGPMTGGMMRFGIPKYRLPREVLDAEIQRILDMGVKIGLNVKVSDIRQVMEHGRYDAAFLAVGAHIAKRAFIPAGAAARILDAVSVLRGMEEGEKPLLGRRVVVYGGGNTALDVARTARRLGASEAIIVYRRNREKMPAHDFEVEEALEEGVLIKWLSTIKAVTDGGTLMVEKMQLDEKGFPQ